MQFFKDIFKTFRHKTMKNLQINPNYWNLNLKESKSEIWGTNQK